MSRKTIKLLVVDDSALVRDILSKGLGMDPTIHVVGTASDPYIARDKIVELKPDVLTLDVEMPRMDGVEFLRRLMPQYPLPVVMVSALTEKGKQITLDALDAGAVDFVTKPKAGIASGLEAMMMELRTKVKIASSANVSQWRDKRYRKKQHLVVPERALDESTDKIIAIGASTGGTEAIRQVVSALPVSTPGIVIVQHMPSGFTELFSERMNKLCKMDVKEAEDRDRIMPGRVLIAPGGRQMSVKRSGGIYEVRIKNGEPVCGHCPSVEVLMQSVALHAGPNAVGIMLTGMGSDGAEGMLAMHTAGARTIAQDEASCVVFGMPMEAFKRGAVEQLIPLEEIAQTTIDIVAGYNK